jgi:hypothetical protein
MDIAYNIAYGLGVAVRFWWISLPVIIIVIIIIVRWRKGVKNGDK